MKVKLLDTLTHETRVVEGIKGFCWADGNWSCDCNRAGYFDVDSDPEDTNTCAGCERFAAVECESEGPGDEGYTLADINAGYAHKFHVTPEGDVTELCYNRAVLENLKPKNMNLLPDPPAPPVMLPREFHDCLLGHHVAIDEAPRLAYSLNKCAKVAMETFLEGEDAARRRVWEMVQEVTAEHGAKAPLFIDDAAFAAEEKPKLWLPGN